MAAFDLIANYVNSLLQEKRHLVDNLVAHGQNVSMDDPWDTLVDAVKHVHNDIQYGTWTPTSDSNTFTSPGIAFLPAKIALSCNEVATEGMENYVSLLNIELPNYGSEIGLSQTLAGTVMSAGSSAVLTRTTVNGITVTVGVFRDDEGVYSVTITFPEDTTPAYKFAGSRNYMWVASARSWDQI